VRQLAGSSDNSLSVDLLLRKTFFYEILPLPVDLLLSVPIFVIRQLPVGKLMETLTDLEA